MRRCATCGEAIYEGEVALVDADGMAYCSAECLADAVASELIVGEEAPLDTGPTWTYEEATRLALLYTRLCDRLADVVRMCRGAAAVLDEQGMGAAAVAYRQAADMVEEAIREAAWSQTERPAATGGDTAGQHAGATAISVPQEGSA